MCPSSPCRRALLRPIGRHAPRLAFGLLRHPPPNRGSLSFAPWLFDRPNAMLLGMRESERFCKLLAPRRGEDS